MKYIFLFISLFSVILRAGENIPFLEADRSASSLVLEGWSTVLPYECRPDEFFLVGALDFVISQSFGDRQVYTIDLEQGKFQYVLFSSGYLGMIVESPIVLGLRDRGVCYLYLQHNLSSGGWNLNHYLCHKETEMGSEGL